MFPSSLSLIACFKLEYGFLTSPNPVSSLPLVLTNISEEELKGLLVESVTDSSTDDKSPEEVSFNGLEESIALIEFIRLKRTNMLRLIIRTLAIFLDLIVMPP